MSNTVEELQGMKQTLNKVSSQLSGLTDIVESLSHQVDNLLVISGSSGSEIHTVKHFADSNTSTDLQTAKNNIDSNVTTYSQTSNNNTYSNMSCPSQYEVCSNNPQLCVYTNASQEEKDEVCEVDPSSLSNKNILMSNDLYNKKEKVGRFAVRDMVPRKLALAVRRDYDGGLEHLEK